MWRVARNKHYLPGSIASICSIGTKMFFDFFYAILQGRLGNPPSQNGCKLTDIMPVRSGYDDGQRDATAVHKQMPFASFFFPDP